MTLVALLALTMHAWAQEQSETIATTDNNTVEGTHFTISDNDNYADENGMTADKGITVTPKNGETITKVVISNIFESGKVNDGNTSVSSGTKEITNGGGTITVTGVNASTFTFTCSDIFPQFGQFVVYYTEAAPVATTVPLTWDAATPNTATLTNGMPAGNVTVSVEYYPQATMLDGAVTAATDVKATTEDALVTIDKSKLTGVAKLMYFVSTDAEATAPAYTATGWTDVLPTAANYTEAGPVKVWYYPVGTNEGVGEATATYSDGDMNAEPLTVTLGAAPLWNAEFDLTDAPEADQTGKWSTNIPEGGVKKGTEVKVTYTGTKKVIGVKAEKKAAPKLLEFEPRPGVKFYYYEGETWGEAINNHPENKTNGWSIDEDDNVMNNGQELHETDNDDNIKSDTPVNPNIGYSLG